MNRILHLVPSPYFGGRNATTGVISSRDNVESSINVNDVGSAQGGGAAQQAPDFPEGGGPGVSPPDEHHT
eukprot:GSA25T00017282001.1